MTHLYFNAYINLFVSFLTQFQLGSLTLIGPSKGGQFISVQVATKLSNMLFLIFSIKRQIYQNYLRRNYSDYDENHDDYEKYHDNYNNVLIIQNNYQPASIEDQQ